MLSSLPHAKLVKKMVVRNKSNQKPELQDREAFIEAESGSENRSRWKNTQVLEVSNITNTIGYAITVIYHVWPFNVASALQ